MNIKENLDLVNVLCPGDQGISLEGVTASKNGLIKLTARQVAHIRENTPEHAAGGLLMIAEVHPGKVSIETVCKL